MAEVAKKIELVMHPGGSATIVVDGLEFPWMVSGEALELGSRVNEYPTLTVSILAEQIVTRFAEPQVSEPPTEDEEQNVTSFGKLGDIIELRGSNTPEPPVNVLILDHLEDNSGVRYLHRVGDEWSWSFYFDDLGSSTDTWEDAVGGYDGRLKVVEVNG